MATVPIVTEVTKAQLDALVTADGLNEGLQYKVTDKNWLLIAAGVDTLFPIDGILNINNGEAIPSYIDTSEILILTPTIIIDELTIYQYTVTIPTDYFPTEIIIKNLSDENNPITATQNGNLFESIVFVADSISVFSAFIAPSLSADISLTGVTAPLGYIAKVRAIKYIF